ncbi:AMP-binding protein [Mycobacterium tuberculosis]|uniref:AMP-binding protein n=1 Tax=Mycobacterium tuberculosis TaxID=1773 RepID=UPI00272D7EEA|nr:AMP-binding protein [Mycobacterium tuberculosis]
MGTLAWNGFRHFEIYFASSGMGAVCHTINPRSHDAHAAQHQRVDPARRPLPRRHRRSSRVPVEGGIHRYTYRDAHRRSRQLANALQSLGVSPSQRVGTLAWNGFRHFEIYFASSGMGAVCHTINPRKCDNLRTI